MTHTETHSPLPWSHHEVLGIITAAQGEGIIVGRLKTVVDELLAVRSVNALPSLVEALENLLARIEHDGGIGEYKGGPAFVVTKARAALALAKGE